MILEWRTRIVDTVRRVDVRITRESDDVWCFDEVLTEVDRWEVREGTSAITIPASLSGSNSFQETITITYETTSGNDLGFIFGFPSGSGIPIWTLQWDPRILPPSPGGIYVTMPDPTNATFDPIIYCPDPTVIAYADGQDVETLNVTVGTQVIFTWDTENAVSITVDLLELTTLPVSFPLDGNFSLTFQNPGTFTYRFEVTGTSSQTAHDDIAVIVSESTTDSDWSDLEQITPFPVEPSTDSDWSDLEQITPFPVEPSTDSDWSDLEQITPFDVLANRPPVWNLPAAINVVINGTVTVNLLDYCTDPDGDSLSFTANENSGLFSINLTGSSLTVNGGNTDSRPAGNISLTANDGFFTVSDSVTVNVLDTSINNRPIIIDPTGDDTVVVIDGGGRDAVAPDQFTATDSDGDAITQWQAEAPNEWRVNSSGVLSSSTVPDAHQSGFVIFGAIQDYFLEQTTIYTRLNAPEYMTWRPTYQVRCIDSRGAISAYRTLSFQVIQAVHGSNINVSVSTERPDRRMPNIWAFRKGVTTSYTAGRSNYQYATSAEASADQENWLGSIKFDARNLSSISDAIVSSINDIHDSLNATLDDGIITFSAKSDASPRSGGEYEREFEWDVLCTVNIEGVGRRDINGFILITDVVEPSTDSDWSDLEQITPFPVEPSTDSDWSDLEQITPFPVEPSTDSDWSDLEQITPFPVEPSTDSDWSSLIPLNIGNLPNVSVSVSPSTILTNGSFTLTWSFSGASSATLTSPGQTDTVTSGGSVTFNGPFAAGTYVYRISATNDFGTDSDSATLRVNEPSTDSDWSFLIPLILGEINSPPICITLPDINIATNTTLLIDISDYLFDPDGDDITISLEEPPPPVVTLEASEPIFRPDETETILWTLIGAPSAIITRPNGTTFTVTGTSGSFSTGSFSTGIYEFMMSATNDFGTTSTTLIIMVGNPPSGISISTFDLTVRVGDSVPILWNSGDAPSAIITRPNGTTFTVDGESTGSFNSGAISIGDQTWIITATNDFGETIESVTITGGNAPNVSVSVSPSTILTNGSFTLTWSFSGASSATLTSPGQTDTVTSGGSVTFNGPFAAGTYVYRISATNDFGTDSDSATLRVNTPNPPSVRVSASNTSPDTGHTVTISWNISGTGLTSISDPFGGSSRSGSRFVNRLFPGSTTYRASATNAGGTRSDSVRVTWSDPPPPNPPSVRVSASNTSPDTGHTVTISWNISGTGLTSISDPFGGSSRSGSRFVNRLFPGSTTYRASATNAGGTRSDSVRVTWSDPPPPNPPSVRVSASNTSPDTGHTVTISWNISGTGLTSISDPFGGSSRSGSRFVNRLFPGSTTYRASATNAGGTRSDSVRVTWSDPDSRSKSLSVSRDTPSSVTHQGSDTNARDTKSDLVPIPWSNPAKSVRQQNQTNIQIISATDHTIQITSGNSPDLVQVTVWLTDEHGLPGGPCQFLVTVEPSTDSDWSSLAKITEFPTQDGLWSPLTTTPTRDSEWSSLISTPTQDGLWSPLTTTPTRDSEWSEIIITPTQDGLWSPLTTTPTEDSLWSEIIITPTQYGFWSQIQGPIVCTGPWSLFLFLRDLTQNGLWSEITTTPTQDGLWSSLTVTLTQDGLWSPLTTTPTRDSEWSSLISTPTEDSLWSEIIITPTQYGFWSQIQVSETQDGLWSQIQGPIVCTGPWSLFLFLLGLDTQDGLWSEITTTPTQDGLWSSLTVTLTQDGLWSPLTTTPTRDSEWSSLISTPTEDSLWSEIIITPTQYGFWSQIQVSETQDGLWSQIQGPIVCTGPWSLFLFLLGLDTQDGLWSPIQVSETQDGEWSPIQVSETQDGEWSEIQVSETQDGEWSPIQVSETQDGEWSPIQVSETQDGEWSPIQVSETQDGEWSPIQVSETQDGEWSPIQVSETQDGEWSPIQVSETQDGEWSPIQVSETQDGEWSPIQVSETQDGEWSEIQVSETQDGEWSPIQVSETQDGEWSEIQVSETQDGEWSPIQVSETQDGEWSPIQVSETQDGEWSEIQGLGTQDGLWSEIQVSETQDGEWSSLIITLLSQYQTLEWTNPSIQRLLDISPISAFTIQNLEDPLNPIFLWNAHRGRLPYTYQLLGYSNLPTGIRSNPDMAIVSNVNDPGVSQHTLEKIGPLSTDTYGQYFFIYICKDAAGAIIMQPLYVLIRSLDL